LIHQGNEDALIDLQVFTWNLLAVGGFGIFFGFAGITQSEITVVF
jgi:hypothetical protein